MLDELLDEHVDHGVSLLSCVCVCCGPPALLALTRCSKRLQQAVAAPLQQAEQQSAAKVCEHIGATLEELSAGSVVAWRSGLPLAQCRHLGAWLQRGGPLEGVATLRLQKEDNRVIEIDLTQLRSRHIAKFANRGVNDELAMVLVRLVAVNASVTFLDLGGNSIGDTGAAAIANAIAVNASVTVLRCARFLTKPS